MLRKISTKFKSRKEGSNGVNGTKGANGTNGINGASHGVTNGTNGESREKPAFKERHSSFTPFKSKKEISSHSANHSASRADVENSFEQFAQLIHVGVRIQMYFLLLKHRDPRHLEEATNLLLSPFSTLGMKN